MARVFVCGYMHSSHFSCFAKDRWYIIVWDINDERQGVMKYQKKMDAINTGWIIVRFIRCIGLQ